MVKSGNSGSSGRGGGRKTGPSKGASKSKVPSTGKGSGKGPKARPSRAIKRAAGARGRTSLAGSRGGRGHVPAPGGMRRGGRSAIRPASVVAEARRPGRKGDESSQKIALAIAAAGVEKKADEVVLLDLRGLAAYADHFVVMSVESERQAYAIANAIEIKMKAEGLSKVGVEGYETGRWILIDYGDVVAHIMSRDARAFYDLEGLWADAPRQHFKV